MTKSKEKFSLREKKYAKTKIALAHEFMRRMQTTRFSDISIKDVCDKVEISEGTFYNYFPHKVDLVCYFNKITILKIVWEIENKKEKLNHVEIIEHVFDAIADEIRDPFLFYEIVSLHTSEHIKPDKSEDLIDAEKIYGFPDYPGIEKIKFVNFENYFAQIIKNAQKEKQISSDFKSDDIVYSLISILIGLPLIINMEDFGKLKKLYKAQLSLLWKGLEVKRGKR